MSSCFVIKFQSDMLGVPVERTAVLETTALGAAYLAGLAVGYWKDRGDIRKLWAAQRAFTPNMAEEQRNTLYAG